MSDEKMQVLGVDYVCGNCLFVVQTRVDVSQIKPTWVCKRHPPLVVLVPDGRGGANVQCVPRPVEPHDFCFEYRPSPDGQVPKVVNRADG